MRDDHRTSRLVLSGLLSLSLATASFPAVAFGEQTGAAETPAAAASTESSTTEGTPAPSTPSAAGTAASTATTTETTTENATGTSPIAGAESTDTQGVSAVSAAPTALLARAPLAVTELYVNSTTGADTNDGSSDAQAFKTIEKAVAAAAANSAVTTIHVQGDFTLSSRQTLTNVTLNFSGDTTVKLKNGAGFDLKGTSKVNAAGATVTLDAPNDGYTFRLYDSAEINDGHFVFKYGNNGFAFHMPAGSNGALKGSSRGALSMDITNGMFMNNSQANLIENAKIDQRYTGDKWQLYEWNGFKFVNSDVTATRLPFYFKSPFSMDNSTFTIDAGGVRWQTGLAIPEDSAPGETLITNNSKLTVKNFSVHWRAKGITIGNAGVTFRVNNGSVVDASSDRNGGLNVNSGTAIFEDGGTFHGQDNSGAQAGAQAGAQLIFKGDSLFDTLAGEEQDNGLADSTGGYVVMGGTHRVKYDDAYQSGKAIPTTDAAHGNEKLMLFTLADASKTELTAKPKTGGDYTYKVKYASADGKKHVWMPFAKVTVTLNNDNATFADGSHADKNSVAMRGNKIGDATPEKSGYDTITSDTFASPTDPNGISFLGWFYKDSNGVEKPFSADAAIDADTTVYAKWDAHTVVYDNGNGVTYTQNIKATEASGALQSYDDVVTNKPEFKVPGKTFTGWTVTHEDGSVYDVAGKLFQANDSVTFGSQEKVLHAKANYTQDEYTVRFSANGGTFADASVFKQHPELFDISTDELGGEVATVKQKALYDQKLSALLDKTIREQLSPDGIATRMGFIPGDRLMWYDTPLFNTGGYNFKDHTSWFWTTPGADPAIQKDMTFYLKWTEDPTVQKVEATLDLPSDLYGPSQADSPNPFMVDADGYKTFSLTGLINMKSVQEKMQEIENLYPNDAAHPENIKLSSTQCTFKAELTLPDGVTVPENASASVEGLGDKFEVKETKVEGQKVTVTFALKGGDIHNYAELKAAVDSMGDANGDVKATVDGFKLDPDKVSNGDELTAVGKVSGTFTSFAQNPAGTTKFFNFTWNGKQRDEGRSILSTDQAAIEQTIVARKAEHKDVKTDMLINGDTTSDHVYEAKKGDTLKFTAQLDATPIQDQMKAIEQKYNIDPSRYDQISIHDLGPQCTFTTTFTVPDAMAGYLTDNVADYKLTGTNAFDVTSAVLSNGGKTVTLTMTLKSGYTNYAELRKAIIDETQPKLELELPAYKVPESAATDTNYSVSGTVSGTFLAHVNLGNHQKDFAFTWSGVQDPAGKDSILADGDEAIQTTYKVAADPTTPDNPTNPDQPKPNKPSKPGKKPSKGKKSAIPYMGDAATIGGIAALAASGLAALSTAFAVKRRRHND